MSALLTGRVYGYLFNSRAEKEVVMALADHGYDDGTHIFPGVLYLAWKTELSERQVQRILRDLEQRQILIAVANQDGGRGKATEYELHLENALPKPKYRRGDPTCLEGIAYPKKGDISRGTPSKKGDISRPERVTYQNLKGDISRLKGDIQMSPQPSREPSDLQPSVRNLSSPAQARVHAQDANLPEREREQEIYHLFVEELKVTPNRYERRKWNDAIAAIAEGGHSLGDVRHAIAAARTWDKGIITPAAVAANFTALLDKQLAATPAMKADFWIQPEPAEPDPEPPPVAPAPPAPEPDYAAAPPRPIIHAHPTAGNCRCAPCRELQTHIRFHPQSIQGCTCPDCAPHLAQLHRYRVELEAWQADYQAWEQTNGGATL